MATELTNVTGLKELDDLLKSLPAKIEGNVMAGALRAGQMVLLKGAQEELRAAGAVDSGALLRSLRVRLQTRSKKYGWVRVNLIAGDKTAWYSHLVEYGTASYYTGKGRSVRRPYVITASDNQGKRFGSKEKRRINHGSAAQALYFQGKMVEKVIHPGAKPKPFMRRAIDKHQQAALSATVAYLRKRIPKEITKAGL